MVRNLRGFLTNGVPLVRLKQLLFLSGGRREKKSVGVGCSWPTLLETVYHGLRVCPEPALEGKCFRTTEAPPCDVEQEQPSWEHKGDPAARTVPSVSTFV